MAKRGNVVAMTFVVGKFQSSIHDLGMLQECVDKAARYSMVAHKVSRARIFLRLGGLLQPCHKRIFGIRA